MRRARGNEEHDDDDDDDEEEEEEPGCHTWHHSFSSS